MQSKFLKALNQSYKNILTEQGPDQMPAPTDQAQAAPPAEPAPAPAAASTPAAETPIEQKDTRSGSDAFLIGLIAKALLINLDDDDRLKVVKYLKSLNIDNVSEIEENMVNLLNRYDYQNLDSELDYDFKISPKKSRQTVKFLNKIIKSYQ
jgi:3-oxoacyl-ACP reductase-like protein